MIVVKGGRPPARAIKKSDVSQEEPGGGDHLISRSSAKEQNPVHQGRGLPRIEREKPLRILGGIRAGHNRRGGGTTSRA